MNVRHGAHCARLCLGIVVTIGTVACAPSPDQSAKSVEYYRSHAEEREASLSKCADDPGRLVRTADCVNAREAARLEGIGSLRDLPPLGLPSPKPPKAQNERSAPR